MAVPPVEMYSGSFWNRMRKPLPLRTQVIRFTVVFVIVSFILAVALQITHERMPDPKVTKPLPDLGFELLTKVPGMYVLADCCIGFLNILSVFTAFKLYLLHRHCVGSGEPELPCNIPGVSRFFLSVWLCKENCRIELRNIHTIAWIRFITSYALLLLFRSAVIVMTSLPAPDDLCQDPPKIENPVKNVILTVLTAGAGSIHCGDLMYSGHTVILTLHLMFHWIYGAMVHWSFRPVVTVVAIFSYYCIVASRFHYTDDVLVAIYLTIATFIAVGHNADGAPWQLQLFIRWWPCCGANSREVTEDSQPVMVAFKSEELDEMNGVLEGRQKKHGGVGDGESLMFKCGAYV
ncbi:sphingomyelin/ceramide phosphorylethanolamine synthase [Trypanosoma brucei equiperdum]|uniref:Sphingomyelin/ceramide phosphorylethanolamine synthase n=1 Tax=Trypanosoma brucei equiperdum TaxID=630700 RepID=A0A3L6L2J1_9TRYP|nr:sphingomyelin/ceramide phosphorylethanolamine synthase [Trypanosoma brucei equiperdum]